MIDVPVLTNLWHPNIHTDQGGHIFANVPGPKPVQPLVAVQSPESPSRKNQGFNNVRSGCSYLIWKHDLPSPKQIISQWMKVCKCSKNE